MQPHGGFIPFLCPFLAPLQSQEQNSAIPAIACEKKKGKDGEEGRTAYGMKDAAPLSLRGLVGALLCRLVKVHSVSPLSISVLLRAQYPVSHTH